MILFETQPAVSDFNSNFDMPADIANQKDSTFGSAEVDLDIEATMPAAIIEPFATNWSAIVAKA